LDYGLSGVVKNGAENVPNSFIGRNYALSAGYRFLTPYSIEINLNNIESIEKTPNNVSTIGAGFSMVSVRSYHVLGDGELYARLGLGKGYYRIDYLPGFRRGNVIDLSHDWSGLSYLAGLGWSKEINKNWTYEIKLDYMGGKLYRDSSTSSGNLTIDTLNASANITYKNFVSPKVGAKIMAASAGAIIGAVTTFQLVTHIDPPDSGVGYFLEAIFSVIVGGGAGLLTGIYLVSDSEERRLMLKLPF